MKTRFAVILLTLNLAALAAGYVYLTRASNARVAAANQSAQAELEAWKAETAGRASHPGATRVVYRTNAFTWSQVESADYRQYIANLRAIGCPEATIKDIILTDVMRLYAQRRGQFYQNGRDFKYWETDEKRHLSESQLAQREKALAQIDKELPAVLRELLGINYEREVNKYFVDAGEEDRRLAFLPDDKRAAALALREEFEGERQFAALTNADASVFQQITQDREAAFSQLLTADEKAQYDLSMSPTADRLRSQLIGFNPSEEEFKDLFAREEAVDEKYAGADLNDPNVAAAKQAEEQAALGAFQASLAPDRAAQLARSQSPEYQGLCELTARFDLPPETSAAMLDVEHAAEAEKQQLLADKDLSPDRLADALKAIQAETEKTVRLTLGDQAFQQYAPTADWLNKLGSH